MSANPRPLVATIYNPHTQSKDALIAGFTARKAKFDRLFRDIAEAPMTKAEQHYLIQGVRGMGKTTFLLRLAYEIENTPELAQQLIPIVFNEEEYGISSLADFWERTARYLEEADPTFAGLEDRMTAQYGGNDYERAALQTLLNALHEHNKKLILLIDNIGDLFRKFDELENKRLREVLLTVPDLRLIGATPTLIEQTHDYSKPYFDFFKFVQLGGLNQQETNDLFLKLGEAYGTDAARELVEKRPGRIEALRRLTGGVIRTMVLLFEIMVENSAGSVFRDLNALVDRVTPLYKHRIDDLPAQQQKIVAALANAWDAANTKELAQVVRLESKVVSAQLKQLINNNIVEKVETNTKNHLYRIEERFFNIWYLMRFGRKTDQRALWLIRFFEEMFDGDEKWLYERIESFLQSMEDGSVNAESALYLTTAFSKVIKDASIEDLLKKKTRLYLKKHGDKYESELDLSLKETITLLLTEKNYQKAAEILTKFQVLDESDLLDLALCNLVLGNNELVFYSIKRAFDFCKISKIDAAFEDNKPWVYHTYWNFIFEGVMLKQIYTNSLYITNYTFDELVIELGALLFWNNNKIRTKIVFNLMENLSFYSTTNNTQYFLIKNLLSLSHNCLDQSYSVINDDIIKWFNEMFYIIDTNTMKWYSRQYSVNYGLLVLFELFLKLLIAKKQYHTAYNYFQQEVWQLKDRFKPLYYATMYFLQDEYPTDYLRMGPELKETVDDILAEIEQMAIDYA